MESHPTRIKYSQTGKDCGLFIRRDIHCSRQGRVMALYWSRRHDFGICRDHWYLCKQRSVVVILGYHDGHLSVQMSWAHRRTESISLGGGGGGLRFLARILPPSLARESTWFAQIVFGFVRGWGHSMWLRDRMTATKIAEIGVNFKERPRTEYSSKYWK